MVDKSQGTIYSMYMLNKITDMTILTFVVIGIVIAEIAIYVEF